MWVVTIDTAPLDHGRVHADRLFRHDVGVTPDADELRRTCQQRPVRRSVGIVTIGAIPRRDRRVNVWKRQGGFELGVTVETARTARTRLQLVGVFGQNAGPRRRDEEDQNDRPGCG
jgi:hypothetical protein